MLGTYSSTQSIAPSRVTWKRSSTVSRLSLRLKREATLLRGAILRSLQPASGSSDPLRSLVQRIHR